MQAPTLAWATVFLVGLTLWMIVAIVVIRFASAAQRGRLALLTRRWEPVFFAAAVSAATVELPRLRRRDRIAVMTVWLRIGDYVSGEAHRRINELGLSLGLGRVAVAVLARPWLRLRLRNPSQVEILLAIRAAERLHLDAPWAHLADLVAAGPAPLDRYAARALVAIDPARAAAAVLPALVRQGRWARHLVEDLIEAGATTAIDAYIALLADAPDDAIPGLALLFDRCGDPRSVVPVRQRLAAASTRDPEALAALLNTLSIIGGAQERDLVRDFVAHPQWFVRMRAAQALGRCGNEHDAATLAVLLTDNTWYTRYHAARAILHLASLGPRRLLELAERSGDRYARDMASHVIAEAAAPAVR